jgi:hypothetical protein
MTKFKRINLKIKPRDKRSRDLLGVGRTLPTHYGDDQGKLEIVFSLGDPFGTLDEVKRSGGVHRRNAINNQRNLQ